MSQLLNEIDANHAAFFKDWTDQAAKNWTSLQSNIVYRESYRRLTALQSLKTYLVAPNYSSGSAAFFYEAHNDALVSHVNASVGAWRAALQALRSGIENTLCAVYYNEHPVELELWGSGNFIIGFSELIKYFEKHPRLAKLSEGVSGLALLRAEYALLSKAVHGSTVNFRMTDPVSDVLLWSTDVVKASMWSTRERRSLEAISLFMVAMNYIHLQGSKLLPLRNVLGLSISAKNRTAVRQSLSVNIAMP